MFRKIVDICFIIFVAVMLWQLLKEFIPDHVKKYWNYIRQDNKDRKAGWFDRKWIWIFKR